MRKRQEPEVSPENQKTIEKIADLLGQANDLFDLIVNVEDDSYVHLLNLIHTRIPEPFMLEQLIRDSDDSEMRCPK